MTSSKRMQIESSYRQRIGKMSIEEGAGEPLTLTWRDAASKALTRECVVVRHLVGRQRVILADGRELRVCDLEGVE